MYIASVIIGGDIISKKTSKAESRINQILVMLEENPSFSVKYLANVLDVSEMTIRRDLKYLKENNYLSDGASDSDNSVSRPYLGNKEEYFVSREIIKKNIEKEKIGKFAAELIERDDMLIIDTGTTTERLANHLPEDRGLTVVCYNYNILNEIQNKSGVDIAVAGGFYHRSTEMFESVQGIELIRSLRVNKVFFSASGIHQNLGMTCSKHYEVPIKRAILECAQRKILLADSSKFGMVRRAFFAQLSEVDEIVTDSNLPEEWVNIINDMGIVLHLV